MIRRLLGNRFLLISQNDHARLSGRLARRFGNLQFSAPDPFEDTTRAAGLHDCGWPMHDDRPTLNGKNYPTDVFESPLTTSLQMWSAAPDGAAGESAYTQLLVSLHVLGLSAYAASKPRTPQELFELNRFQHRECERQEELRRRLGLAIDIPLYLGLAMKNSTAEEERLRRNHTIVQAMDRISLALCCTEIPAATVENLSPRPGQPGLTLHLSRSSPTTLVVDPWPFNEAKIEEKVPYRAVPAREYESDEDFQRAWEGAEMGELDLMLARVRG